MNGAVKDTRRSRLKVALDTLRRTQELRPLLQSCNLRGLLQLARDFYYCQSCFLTAWNSQINNLKLRFGHFQMKKLSGDK